MRTIRHLRRWFENFSTFWIPGFQLGRPVFIRWLPGVWRHFTFWKSAILPESPFCVVFFCLRGKVESLGLKVAFGFLSSAFIVRRKNTWERHLGALRWTWSFFELGLWSVYILYLGCLRPSSTKDPRDSFLEEQQPTVSLKRKRGMRTLGVLAYFHRDE